MRRIRLCLWSILANSSIEYDQNDLSDEHEQALALIHHSVDIFNKV